MSAGWTLVEALKDLRAEFDHEFPARDHASDGSIGDQAHADESSDHNPDETGRTPYEDSDSINEVHAIDVDSDLRRPGVDMQDAVDIIAARHRSGKMAVLQYIIYNRRIISRSWNWDSWHSYTGASPHTEHAHFSARYGSGSSSSNPENYSGSWGLDEIMTKSEFMSWMNEWAKSATGAAALNGVTLDDKIGDTANLNRTVGDVLRDVAKLRGVLVGDKADTANAKLSPASPLAQLLAVPGDVEEIAGRLVQPPTPTA